jgi:hypothetical protein
MARSVRRPSLTEEEMMELAMIADTIVAESAPLAVQLLEQITRLAPTGAMQMAALQALADTAARVISLNEAEQLEGGMSMIDFFRKQFAASLRKYRKA